MFLVDVILTNHHLVVLTSAGLLLSNDLRSVDVTLTSVMEFSYVLNFDMPSSSVKVSEMFCLDWHAVTITVTITVF